MKKAFLSFCFLLSVLSSQAVLTPLVDSITMSDGKKLAVDIYIPNGMSSGPVILIQTPYNRQVSRIVGLPMGIGQNINSSNYIFVITDWRGFYGSFKAAYPGSPDRTDDGYSTVEWITSQTWSNGKVGTWGPSALGKVQFQTAKRNPPGLLCICPLVAAPQFEFNEYYPNGALRTEYLEQLDQLGYGLSNFILAHPDKDNAWNLVEDANEYADSIKVPCFMIGGWYDHNTQLMMEAFQKLRTNSFFSVRTKHKLLMGPWVHGGNGAARVGTSVQGELSYPNSADKNDTMALAFFDYYLRNVNNAWESNPVYTYYQMGQNQWQQSANWPPSGLSQVKFYLHPGGNMTNSPPQKNADSAIFVYNPSDPSPTIGGSTLRSDLEQGPYDQRNDVENRTDNLVFTSYAFSQDVVLKGRVKVHLKVSSDRLDTDFDVRLTDVYPDGRSMLVNDGVMRMRFRNGFTQAQIAMMVPGKIYDCIIELPTSSITFLSGHKIRLIISSSNYPRFNRNMNNGGDMYPGKSTDSLDNPLIANNVVHFSTNNSSYIELPLLNYTSSITTTTNANNSFNVYPNPASRFLTLNLNGKVVTSAKVSLFNNCGALIGTKLISETNSEINIADLSAGVYLLEAELSGVVYRQNFTVIK